MASTPKTKDSQQRSQQTKRTFGIGDMAGTGRYRCRQCGEETTLTGPSDQLPPCPRCGTNAQVRYEPIDEEAVESHGIEEQDHRK